jgi:hypothetical protein
MRVYAAIVVRVRLTPMTYLKQFADRVPRRLCGSRALGTGGRTVTTWSASVPPYLRVSTSGQTVENPRVELQPRPRFASVSSSVRRTAACCRVSLG